MSAVEQRRLYRRLCWSVLLVCSKDVVTELKVLAALEATLAGVEMVDGAGERLGDFLPSSSLNRSKLDRYWCNTLLVSRWTQEEAIKWEQ
jgi:hypothetical protein